VEIDSVEKKRESAVMVEPTNKFVFRLEPIKVETRTVLP
jgi:hypothetical protein